MGIMSEQVSLSDDLRYIASVCLQAYCRGGIKAASGKTRPSPSFIRPHFILAVEKQS
jgi:hypothetical protein